MYYILYLKWCDGYREILALSDSKDKVEDFKNQTIKENAILEDYINIAEIEENKLYEWHKFEKIW